VERGECGPKQRGAELVLHRLTSFDQVNIIDAADRPLWDNGIEKARLTTPPATHPEILRRGIMCSSSGRVLVFLKLLLDANVARAWNKFNVVNNLFWGLKVFTA
jgi:hypothetical protein